MKIRHFNIQYFRNLENIECDVESTLNTFIGNNAQGKTNLLEALYVALRGDSFRFYSHKKDWASVKNQKIAVKLYFESSIGTSHQLEMTNESGQLRHNFDGKKITSTQLRLKHPIVIFSPDDHSLIRGEPEERRSFAENVLIDVVPGFYEVLLSYEQALKQRNSVLKLLREFHKNEEYIKQLKHWNILLAETALKLLELRYESWHEFEKTFQRVIHEILNAEFRPVDISWKSFFSAEDFKKLSHSELIEKYVDNLRINYERDVATGWSHFGPHKDDLEIKIQGISSRSSASQGQSRILAMAMRWAHAEWIKERGYEEPLFFIDDFSSELDRSHRGGLLKRLITSAEQVFLTATDDSFLKGEFLDQNFTKNTLENSTLFEEKKIENHEGNQAQKQVLKGFANSSKAYIVNGRILDRDLIE